MMGLMIEEMVERRCEDLFDVLRIDDGPISDGFREITLIQASDVVVDPCILGATRLAQQEEIVIKDGIKIRRDLALGGKTPHPDAVTHKQVIERAVEGSEISTSIGPVRRIGNLCGGFVETLIAPRVISGEHPVAGQHSLSPVRRFLLMRPILPPEMPPGISRAIRSRQ